MRYRQYRLSPTQFAIRIVPSVEAPQAVNLGHGHAFFFKVENLGVRAKRRCRTQQGKQDREPVHNALWEHVRSILAKCRRRQLAIRFHHEGAFERWSATTGSLRGKNREQTNHQGVPH